jgi:hypothetical protein
LTKAHSYRGAFGWMVATRPLYPARRHWRPPEACDGAGLLFILCFIITLIIFIIY